MKHQKKIIREFSIFPGLLEALVQFHFKLIVSLRYCLILDLSRQIDMIVFLLFVLFKTRNKPNLQFLKEKNICQESI